MTVYVDDLEGRVSIRGLVRNPAKELWCHMATDGDIRELHGMADKIGLKRKWFQDHPLHPHYDLKPSKRDLAIGYGATPVTTHELVKRCSKYVRGLAAAMGREE